MTTASVIAQLSVRRGRAAIEFYKAAFGAVEEYRVGGTEANEAVVAQLAIGGSVFWVADESPAHANHSPESLGGATTRMLLIVDDPQATAPARRGRGRRRSPPGDQRARLAARTDRRSLRSPLGDRQTAHRVAAARGFSRCQRRVISGSGELRRERAVRLVASASGPTRW